jgi:vacuolar-type H+-ATPase subunit H
MGSFLCRQPNGLLCRFSSIVDCITEFNMTDEEYIQEKMEEARKEAEDTLKNHLKPFEWVKERTQFFNMKRSEFLKILKAVQ